MARSPNRGPGNENFRGSYTPEVQKIIRRRGGYGAFPGKVRFKDAETGEVIYSNEDIAWLAKSIMNIEKNSNNDDWKFQDATCSQCKKTRIARLDGIYKEGWRCTSCWTNNLPLDIPEGETGEKIKELLAKIIELDSNTGKENKDGKS